MPVKAERIKVEVTDSTDGETRTFNITMMAPVCDFQLSDLLQRRGVISALNGELKQAVRVATEDFLSNAEALIATLKQEPSTSQNARSNGKQKARNATRKAPTAAGTSELNNTLTPVLNDES